MKILVTGGAGFIWSHLIDSLIEQGHDVVCIDDLSGGFPRNINKACIFYQTNLSDENQFEKLNDIFEEHQFDYVYHLAAYAAEGLSHFIRIYNYKNNLIASVNLINLSIIHKVKKFIFTSSMATYGTNQVPFNEEMHPDPEDPYGTAKLAVEQDLEHARRLFGLNYTIFRPHNVVGSRQHIGDTFRNVVGIFINQVMRGEPMTIFGDGEQTRAFSYVGDIIPYFLEAMTNEKSDGQVYNVGGEVPYSIKTLAEKIQERMGGEITHEPPRYEVKHAHSNHEKLYQDFGKLKDPISLDEILDEMIPRAISIWPQEPCQFEWIEIIEKLPPKWLKYVE